MKFTRIIMNNFMRYKGTNTIEFSCDKDKNVTVVLGDNTVGKTTIAQAFRFGLYGAILAEKGKKESDYLLLNEDVLALMDANSRAKMSVQIEVEDEEKRYVIYREIEYVRLYPGMMAKDTNKKVTLSIAEKGTDGFVEVDTKKVDELINELFPRNLSHYFLFDGERWNDVSVNGVKENIKDSVHILTGLSSYQAALFHLKEMGSYSVISKLKKKITGSGSMYDNLEKEMQRAEREIEQTKASIKTIEVNIANYERKVEEAERFLEENKSTEQLQMRKRQTMMLQKSQAGTYQANYKAFVNEISDKMYMIFAEPMVESALKIVKSVAGERRDIPYMRQASIDYILKSGTCICGTRIHKDSKELECLLEQRNYLPPADMGSLLGEFEQTSKRWKSQCDGVMDEVVKQAKSIDDNLRDYEDTCNQLKKIEQESEEHIDFAEKKQQLRRYNDEVKKLYSQKGELTNRLDSYAKQITNIELEMKSQEAKNEENIKWNKRVEIADAVYKKMKQDFELKEQQVFSELNSQIQYNFERMFNAKDKKIELNKQYEIQMLYKTDLGYREEKNLSEGEKIARNFAFIVTIMDYSRKRKMHKQDDRDSQSDTLPIVLDGPFSKLGDENIGLIAKVLPEVSEQVIIFMLKKDWKYTKLDPYVGATYYIDKDADKAYASIEKGENL